MSVGSDFGTKCKRQPSIEIAEESLFTRQTTVQEADDLNDVEYERLLTSPFNLSAFRQHHEVLPISDKNEFISDEAFERFSISRAPERFEIMARLAKDDRRSETGESRILGTWTEPVSTDTISHSARAADTTCNLRVESSSCLEAPSSLRQPEEASSKSAVRQSDVDQAVNLTLDRADDERLYHKNNSSDRPRADTERPAEIPVATPISSLCLEEHAHFLRLQHMQKTNPDSMSQGDREAYASLSARVKEEQELYYLVDKNLTIGIKERLGYINHKIERGIQELQRRRHAAALKYPRYYLDHRTLSIAPSTSPHKSVAFRFLKIVHQKGKCHALALPSMKAPVTMSNSQACVDPQNSSQACKWCHRCKPPVSTDPVAQRLAAEHDIDMVISSSTLSALASMGASQVREVELPVVVKEVMSNLNDAEKGRSVVYFDKPCACNDIGRREQNDKFFKNQMKAQFLNIQGADATVFSDVLMTDQSQKNGQNEEGEVDASNEIDVTGTDQNDNLQYAVWELGALRLLVRYTIHGWIPEKRSGQKRYAYVQSKMEYQLERGLEQLTNEESIRLWIKLLIRPESQLVLVRFNPMNSQLVHIERGSLEDMAVETSWPLAFSQYLHDILTSTKSLSLGTYLIWHGKGADHLTIKKSVSFDRASDIPYEARLKLYDLHGKHQDITLRADEASYIPLEWKGSLDLPLQIPYTFTPIPKASIPSRKPVLPIKWCRAYRFNKQCQDTSCQFAHLSDSEVRRLQCTPTSPFVSRWMDQMLGKQAVAIPQNRQGR
ncbi:uncharacterized protein SPPG_03937 [Spizellomyces punctatus DAOM BR117]|uniref:Uncharacterized protein n=1 Tax=Spizellomyces punctatus (strain DAOM BR117) TaxID=645134 RepID=A0A0L0HH90_SPIPD|nr:uncharacterized protein SPPG_03937 [Spizellomyces punctatus DAOM BR117]KND00831.1 hypothetical protein SPPG_03937 [Spizellomyces punctatus DAOM BR117]|eukprot:XP_016608870.1 hypothetical protein SPPG_03937 [Spizellomyces punctatus DAOM BR117]